MRIERVEVWQVEIPLSEPYTIAYTHTDRAANVFLRLHTNAHHVGIGAANPDVTITGETTAMVAAGLETCREVLIGADPLDRAGILAKAAAALPARPATLAVLDMALFDILGKVAQLPLYRLLGASRNSIRTATTIGIEPVEKTVELARDWVARGFGLLKIKGGLDLEADIARMHKVREVVGDKIDLCFDANQGYSFDASVEFSRRCAHLGILFIEQPSPKEDLELLGRIRQESTLPVMADECMCSAADAYDIARHDRAQWINLKLMKVGGITPGLAIVAVAQAAGLAVMVGCMDESVVSIAAGLHLALASPQIDLVDLDGHLALSGDPAAGQIGLEQGCLIAPAKPGLGVELG